MTKETLRSAVRTWAAEPNWPQPVRNRGVQEFSQFTVNATSPPAPTSSSRNNRKFGDGNFDA